MITIRPINDADWPRIRLIAEASVRHLPQAGPQDEWVRNRVAFTGRRWRFVAEDERGIVGYGALEGHRDRIRRFVVVPWGEPDSIKVADALTGALSAVARAERISTAWMREYAADDVLIGYLLSRGSELGEAYTHGSEELVDLHDSDVQAEYRIDRAPGRLSETDEAALGLADADVFGIEDLNFEWRRKDDHFVLRQADVALCHVGILDGVSVACAGTVLQVAGVGGVVTRASRRGRGLARKVLSYALWRIAKESTADFALLFCLDRLVPYYQSLGWQIVEDPVKVINGEGFVESPLNVLAHPLRRDFWPRGPVTVHERHF